MARIRSIKPEFWKDARIARLSKDCALFFIGLWNFCDDEGKRRTDPFEISLNMPSFRSQDVVKHISRLAQAGLIRLSVNRDWLLVTNWQHQKIDKPKKPTVSKEEIQWLDAVIEDHSSNIPRTLSEPSSNDRRKERIGKDRKGSGKDHGEGVAVATPPRSVEVKVGVKTLGARIWDAYTSAIKKRWGFEPASNPTVRGQCTHIGTRLGEEAIPSIEFYVSQNNDGYLMKNHHPIGAFLKMAETYHGQWQRGQAVTSQQVRQFEKQSGNMDLLEKVRRGEA